MREEIKIKAILTWECNAKYPIGQQIELLKSELFSLRDLTKVDVLEVSTGVQTILRTPWVLITVVDGEIQTEYYGKDIQAETVAYQMLMAEWPDDEPKPDNFEEAYEVSRPWSEVDMRIEQCPSN